MDYGERVASRATADVQKRLRKLYAQAEKKLKKKTMPFRRKFEKKQAEMLDKLERGKITEAAYESWMRSQVFGKSWVKKIPGIVSVFIVANKVANRLIERSSRRVFSENYKYNAYETEKETGDSLDIQDEDTIDTRLLPSWRIDEEKDYAWNEQKVYNSVTQGIMNHESVDQIAERLANDLGSTNMNKMRMFARTAMTSAKNAGVQKQMEDTIFKGILVKKQWVATLDNRTRDTHQHLDGKIVNVDESFSNGLMYPGDPSGSPAEVYNCRCSLKTVLGGMENKKRFRRVYEEPDETGRRRSYLIEDVNYDDWLEWKKKVGKK